MKSTDLNSLIRLLDDPNHEVFDAIRSKLNTMGSNIIPQLEIEWENSLDELFQTRIEHIIHDIHQQEIERDISKWANQENNDLFTGIYIITRFQYPDTSKEELRQKIDAIKNDVWLEINDHLTALEKVKIINHILFEVHGFNRSNSFQSSAQSNFINNVLEQKKGSPITLSILYAIIAQELNIPIMGVALPRNFILCYKNIHKISLDKEFNEDVLFYINPFNKGTVFGRKEIDNFIKQQKLEKKKTFFIPCNNKKTISILIKKLIEFYETNAENSKADDFREILNCLKKTTQH